MSVARLCAEKAVWLLLGDSSVDRDHENFDKFCGELIEHVERQLIDNGTFKFTVDENNEWIPRVCHKFGIDYHDIVPQSSMIINVCDKHHSIPCIQYFYTPKSRGYRFYYIEKFGKWWMTSLNGDYYEIDDLIAWLNGHPLALYMDDHQLNSGLYLAYRRCNCRVVVESAVDIMRRLKLQD